jgi:hypothetical protein
VLCTLVVFGSVLVLAHAWGSWQDGADVSDESQFVLVSWHVLGVGLCRCRRPNLLAMSSSHADAQRFSLLLLPCGHRDYSLRAVG